MNIIGTKWGFRNKLNENGEVVRNKAIIVCKVYSQEEGIDIEEKISPMARMEAIIMVLVFSVYKDFKVYQMDVKSTLLNGESEEEVYMEQPEGFQFSDQSNMVCKLKKALYGLKQVPRDWYEKFDRYLIQ